jgi:hypothetical protein
MLIINLLNMVLFFINLKYGSEVYIFGPDPNYHSQIVTKCRKFLILLYLSI